MQANEVRARLMENPGFAEAYRQLGPNGQVARAIIGGRVRLGMTQADLSKLSGVSRAAIANYEHLLGNPTVDTLRKIATALERRLNIIFELEEGEDE